MYAHVQRVDGPIAVHFDLGVDDVRRPPSRLVALGATQVSDFDIWRVMRSPGGLAFCLVPRRWRIRTGTVGVAGRPSQPARAALRRLARRPPRRGGRVLARPRPAGGTSRPCSRSTAASCSRRHRRRCGCCSSVSAPTTPAPRPHVHVDLGTDDIPAEVARSSSSAPAQPLLRRGLGAARRPERHAVLRDADPAGLTSGRRQSGEGGVERGQRLLDVFVRSSASS